MDATVFCPVCLDEVVFETRKCVETIDVDGKTCSFESSLAICPHCGEELDSPPYQREAGRAYSDAIRSAKGLVSLETVRDLPRRYHIGKRPLSKLLGWGEITYTRFMDGHVPSKTYSDRIQELYDHPASYRRALIEGKERITDSAFKNSLAAVDRILADDYPDVVRLLEVGEYFCRCAKGDITAYSIQKLVYLAQGFSLVLLDKPLFPQVPSAWAAGPVYGQLWRDFKSRDLLEEYGGGTVGRSESVFARDQEDLLQEVFRSFGRFSGNMLSDITHFEGPWLDARKRAGAAPGERCQEKISLDSMRDYFGSAVERFRISKDKDGMTRFAEDIVRRMAVK